MRVREIAERIQPQLVELRRYFHMYPEPSWKEANTANKIVAELTKLGIPVIRLAKTGVVGTLKGGQPGPTVALRADIDALSIKEQAETTYVSRNDGYMHACGHDCHIACLLGAAMILSQLDKDEIYGTVKFLFQPAEEVVQGAKKMVEDGAMETVDAVFGIHVWGDLPVGKVNVEPGPRMAAADRFTITVEGEGGHGSSPHQGVDAVVVGSAIVMNLQTIVSRELNPLDPVVVHVGRLVSGDSFNIIARQAMLEGGTRCFNSDTRNRLPEIIQRVVNNTATTFRAKAKLEYYRGCPPTINDNVLTEIGQGSVMRLYGKKGLVSMPRVTASEDFPFYTERVPGAFAFLGVSNPNKGIEWPQHHSCYDVDEDALSVGAAVYAQFALDFLRAPIS